MDNNFQETYAPRSPDLSNERYEQDSFQNQQRQQVRGSISHTLTPFTPTDRRNPFSSIAGSPFSAQANPFASNQGSYFPPQQPYGLSQPLQSPYSSGYRQDYPFTSPFKSESNDFAYPGVELGHPMAPNTRKKIKTDPTSEDLEYQNGMGGAVADAAAPEVRTKFPVARIKRIMQSDEDVGKVAQVTPVVVSKALELFMIDLVTAAATEAKTRSSKRVTAAHLKQAVMSDEKYTDWLGEIVGKVPDAPAKASAAKDEDSDDWGNDAPPTSKKKRATGGTKRRKREEE